ncbi:MAG: acyl carrier protein [Thermodesulfobacteriota bacterium]
MPVENRRRHIETVLLEFLREEVFDVRIPLTEHTDLLESGFDSLALLRLLNFTEQRLGIRIPEEEITENRIKTVRSLAEWIDALGNQEPTGP